MPKYAVHLRRYAPSLFRLYFMWTPQLRPVSSVDPVLEVDEGLLSPSHFAAHDCELEQAALTHRCYLAFGEVDLEFEGAFQIPRDGTHHLLGSMCSPTHTPARKYLPIRANRRLSPMLLASKPINTS
jgi:hypothetical protein